MTCLNPACENHQKDLGTTKFCPECGQKTASPEPRSLICPSAGCANQGKDLCGMKFCPECGTTTVVGGATAPKGAPSSPPQPPAGGVMPLPQVQLPSGYAAYQEGGAGSVGGGRSIIAGDQNITHSTVVHNQDQSKQVRQCAVSGRQAEVTRGHVCPSCRLWVHEDYFDRAMMCCDNCRKGQAQRATDQFQAKARELLSDGVITKEELSELRSLGDRRGMSLPEQDTIINRLKQELLKSASPQRPMSLIDQTRLKAVLRAVENKVFSTDPVAGRAQLDSLRALHKSHPDNDLIASLLVSILTEEAVYAPEQFLPEIERVLNAPCFTHDTPQKYLTRAIFYRGGMLLGQVQTPHSDGEGNWSETLEQFNEGLRETAVTLESLFPDSAECHALQIAMMIDSYHLSGDESIREEANLLLEGAAGAAGEGDVRLVLKAAYANVSEGLAWGEEREVPMGRGLAREYFGDLFSFNLVSLQQMMAGDNVQQVGSDGVIIEEENVDESHDDIRKYSGTPQGAGAMMPTSDADAYLKYNKAVDVAGIIKSFGEKLGCIQSPYSDNEWLARTLEMANMTIPQNQVLMFHVPEKSGFWLNKIKSGWFVTSEEIVCVHQKQEAQSISIGAVDELIIYFGNYLNLGRKIFRNLDSHTVQLKCSAVLEEVLDDLDFNKLGFKNSGGELYIMWEDIGDNSDLVNLFRSLCPNAAIKFKDF